MDHDFKEAAHRRRAPIRDAASGLEFALAAPVGTGPVWRQRVEEQLDRTRAALAEHVELTEGPTGLYAELQHDAPGLSNLIKLLGAEHETMRSDIDAVVAALRGLPPLIDDQCCEQVREAALVLLGRISRHRQKGADLIWRAYNVDIGGE